MTHTIASAPGLDAIRAAAKTLTACVLQTPLLRLNLHDSSQEIYLKAENLQAIGVFKVRSMGNVLLRADRDSLARGVYTASSGNAGIGLAWMANKLGLAATVYAPASGPAGKLGTMRKLGATVKLLDDAAWWQIILDAGHPADPGFYVDAVRDPAALAGNGTIGLEIMAQLPDVDSVIVPFGGGGLVCGIAAAIRAIKADTRIIVAEAGTAAPLSAAFKAGNPVAVKVQPSFISGAGGPSVLAEMWPLVSELVDETVAVPVTDVANAVRLLFRQNRLVAEGAGALPVAAALAAQASRGKTVCIVSGGNIDPDVMARILLQQSP